MLAVAWAGRRAPWPPSSAVTSPWSISPSPTWSAGAALTARLGLSDHVTHRTGDALALEVGADPFDIVWTQNGGMNVSDKERLYAGFARLLRRGGLLAIQEPMAGPVQPPIFPVMWARDATSSFLRSPEEMRGVMEAAGFRARA